MLKLDRPLQMFATGSANAKHSLVKTLQLELTSHTTICGDCVILDNLGHKVVGPIHFPNQTQTIEHLMGAN